MDQNKLDRNGDIFIKDNCPDEQMSLPYNLTVMTPFLHLEREMSSFFRGRKIINMMTVKWKTKPYILSEGNNYISRVNTFDNTILNMVCKNHHF